MLKCERCWKFTPEVGKIKLHPDICLKCAEVMEFSYKASQIYERFQEYHEKTSRIKGMKATHKIGKLGLCVVYMSEEAFVEMYKDKIKYLDEGE
jgi:hypothetical protein